MRSNLMRFGRRTFAVRIIQLSLVLVMCLSGKASGDDDEPQWKNGKAVAAEAAFAKANKDAAEQFRKAKLAAAQSYIRSLRDATVAVAKAGNNDEIGKLSIRIKEVEAQIQRLQLGDADTFEMIFTIQSTSDWTALGFPDREWKIVDVQKPERTRMILNDEGRGTAKFYDIQGGGTITVKIKFDARPKNPTPLVVEKGNIGATTVKFRRVGEKAEETLTNGGGSGGVAHNTKRFDDIIKPKE